MKNSKVVPASTSIHTKVAKAKKVTFGGRVDKITTIDEVVESNKVFSTFTSDRPLQDGMSLIRNLGGGKYEIVNLDAVSQNVIASDEVAQLIKEVPERAVALGISRNDWNAAIMKCDVAVRLTKSDLFRIFKLPDEVLLLIYEFVMINPDGLRLNDKHPHNSKPFAALSFMLTCKDVYKEAVKLFFQNTFHLHHRAIVQLRHNTDFANKLEVVEFLWNGGPASRAIFRSFNAYANLRVLHLKLWVFELLDARPEPNYVPPLLRDDKHLKLFAPFTGVSELLGLRGLQKVIFEFRGDFKGNSREQELTAARKVMEDLLNRELTKPKPLPLIVSPKKDLKGRALARRLKAEAAAEEEATEDRATEVDESEESEREYVAKPTRTRGRKIIESDDEE